MRMTLPLAVVLALTSVNLPAADPEASPRTPEVRAAAASCSVERLEQELDRLAGELDGSRYADPSVPVAIGTELVEIAARARSFRLDLVGLDWTVTEPLLARIRTMERRIAALDARALAEHVRSRATEVRAATGSLTSGTGTLMGTVYGPDGITPLAGIEVRVYRYDWPQWSAVTDAEGHWRVDSIPPGSNTVATYGSPGWVDQLWHGHLCDPSCDTTFGEPLVLGEGTLISDIDFTLQPSGAIAGVVTDRRTGAPLDSISVRLLDARGAFVKQPETAEDGSYVIEDLVPGTYFVGAWQPYRRAYLDQLYQDTAWQQGDTIQNGTPIVVTSGATTGGIDFAMDRGGTISGTVIDQRTGGSAAPLAIRVYDMNGDLARWTELESGTAYAVVGLEQGLYFVRTDGYGIWRDELYDDIPCESGCDPTTGAPVWVDLSQDVTGIDFALSDRGRLEGRVIDEDAGTGLASNLSVYTAAGSYAGSVDTQPDGSYSRGGLESGTYVVIARSATYRDELWDDLPCDPSCDPTAGAPVQVVNDQTTGQVDFSLPRNGSITGVVTAEATGLPVGSAQVTIFNSHGWTTSTVYADLTGSFEVLDVNPGTYYAAAGLLQGGNFPSLASELYDDILCGGWCDPLDGTPIPVELKSTAAGIDFSLTANGSLSGTVRDELSLGPVAATVEIYDSSGTWVRNVATDALGHYRAPGLVKAPGTKHFFVRFTSRDHVDELFDDVECEEGCDVTAGTPVAVTFAAETSSVDAELLPFARITGHVLDGKLGGGALEDLTVCLFDGSGAQVWTGTQLMTDPEYEIGGLLPGTYYALTRSSMYVDELWDDLPCEPDCDPTTGTPITVDWGDTIENVDFELGWLGQITGTVVDATTAEPIAGAGVRFYHENGDFAGVYSTLPDGSYTGYALPDGSYFVVARKWYYERQLYDGIPCDPSCDVTTGVPVTVANHGETAGIDFALPRYGGIDGVVTTSGTGEPLVNVTVRAHLGDGTIAGSATTTSTGNYRIPDLAPGEYFVSTSSPHVDQLYDGLPCEPTCDVTAGAATVVPLGTFTPGIDFHLVTNGLLAGAVTFSPTGSPIRQVTVRLYSGSGTPIGSAASQPGGEYRFLGVGPGTYYLATSNGFGLVDRLWDGEECEPACDPTISGTPIQVASGQAVLNIDFSLRYPFFADVPLPHWARRYIESLWAAQVTAGCGVAPLRYCPTSPVAREQMAVFLLKADEGGGYVPPAAVGMFSDVDVTSPFAPWIEELARRGITAGCGGGMYCPSAPVSREQMAVFLLKTLEGAGYVPPDPTGVFGDVDLGSPFAPWIEELVRRAITAGCQADPPLYCPSAEVGRDQMGVFLTKTFALPPAQ